MRLGRDEAALALLGSAVRQDGRSASLTAPSGQAQEGLVIAALGIAFRVWPRACAAAFVVGYTAFVLSDRTIFNNHYYLYALVAALLALCPAAFAAAMPLGVAAAAIQQIMPANMRAQGSALYLFVINLIGLGLGPSAVAWCTDYVFQDPNKVNLSLMWVGTFFGLLSAVLLYFGSKHYRSTLNYLEAYNEKQMA